MKKLFFLLMMALLPLAVSAEERVFIGEFQYELISNSEAYLRYIPEDFSGDLVIPGHVVYNETTYTVIGILDNIDRKGITSITIPSTFDGVGGVFKGCTSVAKITYHSKKASSLGLGFNDHVKEVVLGSEVKEISSNAFEGYTALSSIIIPESVDTIRFAAFQYCTSLSSSIVFPDGLKCIADNAFKGCTGLTDISFSETVDSIGNEAFRGCTGLKSLTLPKQVRSIGNGVFSDCTGLTEVKLPEKFEYIGRSVFSWSGLTEVTIPDSWETIPAEEFAGCEQLTKIDLGKGVKSIGNYAFSGSHGPARLHIPAQVTSIGEGAFGCEGILEFYTGDGLTEIEYNFFPSSSPSITISPNVKRLAPDVLPYADKIFWLPETPPEGYKDQSKGMWELNYVPNEHYPNEHYGEEYDYHYHVRVYPKLNEMFVNNGVRYVPVDGDSCDIIDCTYDEQIQTVVIPKTISNGGSVMTVRKMLPDVFCENPFIQDVTIEADIPMIAEYAFTDCSSLKRFTITDRKGVLGIDGKVFDDDGSHSVSSIEYFYLGANAKNLNLYNYEVIATDDWEGCFTESLRELVIGDSVTSIGLRPNSPNLTRLELGRNLYNIKGSFVACTGLTNIICKASLPPVFGAENQGREDRFSEDTKANCQLQVPEENLSDYKKADTWKDFSQIVTGDFRGEQILVDHVWYKLNEKSKTAEAFRIDDFEYTGEVEILEEVSRDGVSYAVNAVHERAFFKSKPSSIVIPKTINYIGDFAFATVGFYHLTCHLEKPVEVEEMSLGKAWQNDLTLNWHVDKYPNAILYVPKGSKSLFEESEYWNRFNVIDDEHDGEVFVDNIRYRINKSTKIAELYFPFDDYYPTSIVIPTTISDGSLSYSVQVICDNAFSKNHENLTSVTLPASLKKICRGAFAGTSLESLDLPDGLEEIGDYAFNSGYYENAITKLTIPASMKSIGIFAFYTNNLESVTSYLEDPFDVDVSVFAIKRGRINTTYSNNNATLYVPKGTKEKYEALSGWTMFKDIQEMEESEIETTPIEISDAKQVPYCSDKNLDFTDLPDLKAYVATGYEKATGTIWLTRVMQVPAETGFLLIGDPGDYDIPTIDGVSDVYYKNMFKGTLTGTTIYTTDGDYTNYYLSSGASGVGFYKVTNENGVSIKANRCYLPILTDIPAGGSEGDAEVIKVSAAKQVPYYTSKNIDFSSLDDQGVKAYMATGYNYKTGIIWLTRVKKVPAQTGILVMADKEGEYSVPTTSVQSVYENMFTGSETAQTIYTTETVGDIEYINYYLSNGASGIGFYKVTNEAGVKMGANRSYLQIPKRDSVAGARGNATSSFSKMVISDNDDDVIAIPLFTGDATGISDVQQRVGEKEVWYNLQGQRVDKPGKGFYIKNGKKVVIK